jgi:hypothetical protein
MKDAAVAAESLLFDDWFDAIEDGIRARVCGFIETMLEEELSGTLSRPRYERGKPNEDGEPPLVVGLAQPPQARADRDLRKDGDFRAAGPTDGRRRQDERMEKRLASRLPTPHQGGRRADRRGLSFWNQHPPNYASDPACPLANCVRHIAAAISQTTPLPTE